MLRGTRHLLALNPGKLLDALPADLPRTHADSLVAEVLPFLDACRFLEREAGRLLKPRLLRGRGRPFWLAGVSSEIHRVPFGNILVIGPANYPLFLPGVQTLQALAAGNAVVWKPGRGGSAVAHVVAASLAEAGLAPGLLRIADETVESGIRELEALPDKVCFTGSADAGKCVLRSAAESTTPVVAELSGCDAVFVLPSADRHLLMDALMFGMRLNGSATCMAPRRLIFTGLQNESWIDELRERFATLEGVVLAPAEKHRLGVLLESAQAGGATVFGDSEAVSMKPLLVVHALPEMKLAQSDLFVPILTVLEARSVDDAVAMHAVCPFALTAAIFGEEHAARALAARLDVGTVVINDLIVSTADARVPFGGRRASGFGSTRGAEGLLEMTAVKTIAVSRSLNRRRFDRTNDVHEAMFKALIRMSHGATWAQKFEGLRKMVSSARQLES